MTSIQAGGRAALLMVVAGAMAGCQRGPPSPPVPSTPSVPAAPAAPHADTSADVMKAGLAALYTARDPERAAEIFRGVLAKAPGHYGATYQLATALTAAGQFDEARPIWQRVLVLAGQVKDTPSAAEASRQLQSPGPAYPEVLMKRGLDALYRDHDAVKAAALFRAVLAQQPTHYGAHYQLAVALDRAGQPTEATPMWRQVLAISVAIQDEKTAATARQRLALVIQPDGHVTFDGGVH